ncbi:uncharacterized protein LOC124120346 isoform X2 [Haliotis rufescens]|uniref:uncharacterized protein LOC124120346 isoform X2 n=1 Tax=Haliotis rufescens TaxID=6454 RepID=UPI00201F3839|nr:uncharacterized protein LOC124120346 isoform X2 [Haliotis rufescens]
MMCSWSWTTVICVLLFSHSCIGGAPTAASTVYIRFGETATLAWNLHGSGNKDFFVRNDFWKETVFHITNFNEFNIANEKLKSRLEFTGNINSSGAGLFSFVLSRADDHDFGQYSCYLGSPQRPGTKIPNCGQQLVVIRVQEPYIEGPEKVSFGSSVDLTCNSFLKSYPNWNLSMNFVWMKNGTSVENGGRHQLASGSRVWRGGRYMNNTLTISGVTRKDRAHRYTCQTVVGDNILTDHSVDYVLSVEYVPKSPQNLEVHEGDTVLLSMRTPQHQSRIYLQDPNDINVFEMDSAEGYIWETYWTRIKILKVITSSDNVTVQFQLSDVTSADAGRYHCSLEKGGHADCDWEHVLVVFNNSVTGSASPSVATSTTDNSVTGSASPSVATSTDDTATVQVSEVDETSTVVHTTYVSTVREDQTTFEPVPFSNSTGDHGDTTPASEDSMSSVMPTSPDGSEHSSKKLITTTDASVGKGGLETLVVVSIGFSVATTVIISVIAFLLCRRTFKRRIQETSDARPPALAQADNRIYFEIDDIRPAQQDSTQRREEGVNFRREYVNSCGYHELRHLRLKKDSVMRMTGTNMDDCCSLRSVSTVNHYDEPWI